MLLGTSPSEKVDTSGTRLLRIYGNSACRYYAGDCRNGVRTRGLKVMSLASCQLLYPALRPRTLRTLALLRIRSIRACRYYGGDKPPQNRTEDCSFGDCRDPTSLGALEKPWRIVMADDYFDPRTITECER